VVHAVERPRDIGLGFLVSDLHWYGHVLADDLVLTVIASLP
jgi:hypothetical protein